MRQLLTVVLAFLSILVLFHAVDAFAENTGRTYKECPYGLHKDELGAKLENSNDNEIVRSQIGHSDVRSGE